MRWPARSGRFSRSVRSLQVRNYRLFFIGHAVSVSGTWMQRVAQDWVVLELTGSALDLGTTTALQFAPILLFGLWGGVLADRLNRRRTLIVTQLVQLVLAAGLAALAWADALTLGAIYAFALALGLVTVIDQPARQSIVTDLVDRGDYANAQVLNSAANNLGKFIGPALAGGIIAWTGPATAFTLNAASFVAIVLGLLRMNPAAMHPRTPVPRARGQIRAGLRYVWTRPDLRTAIGLLVVVALLGQNFRIVLPLVADDLFDGDAGTYGALLAAIGAGAVLAAFTTAGREAASIRGLIVATLSFGVADIALAFSPVFAVAAGLAVAVGFANFVLNTLVRTVLQLGSDRSMHGRVLALHGMVFLGSTPIGSPLLGWIIEQWGARVGVLTGGVGAIAAALVAAAFRLRRRQARPGPDPGDQ